MLEEIHAATPPQAKSAGVSGGKKRAAPGAEGVSVPWDAVAALM